MRFIQIIESKEDPAKELADVRGYAEQAGDDVTVQRVTVCGDRDLPGVTIFIAEFESAESAKQNDEAEITQEAAAPEPDGTTYRTLAVHGVVDF
jgi:hypothetical protein